MANTEVMRHKIVIVGAGMAGLGAAHHLTKSNFSDYLIVDALAEPGGRVKTIPFENGVLELGAQWVHGVDTTLHELAVKNNLIHPQTSNEGEGLYIRDDGRIIDDWLVKKVDFQVGRILEECEGFVDAEFYPESLGDFLERNFIKFVEEWDNEAEKAILWELYDWHVKFQLIDNSCGDLRGLSAREWGRYCCLGKDGQAHINLKGGYGSLVNLLVEELPKGNIRLNFPVEKITINSENLVEIHPIENYDFEKQPMIDSTKNEIESKMQFANLERENQFSTKSDMESVICFDLNRNQTQKDTHLKEEDSLEGLKSNEFLEILGREQQQMKETFSLEQKPVEINRSKKNDSINKQSKEKYSLQEYDSINKQLEESKSAYLIPSKEIETQLQVVESTTILQKNAIDSTQKQSVALTKPNPIKIIAEHVILTPSISVLQNHPNLLSFEQPDSLKKTIASMGFGGMGKVFLVFDKPWWNKTGYQLIFQRREKRQSKWTDHISGFDPVLDQPKVLLGWVAAEGAEIMESLSEEQVGIDCVDMLRVFLKNVDVPYPVRVFRSNWMSCKWIGGGYSHTTPKCDAHNVGAETLTQPLHFGGVPRVVFAGEAAHPTHFSTTHGAFESGEEQAGKLLEYIQHKRA